MVEELELCMRGRSNEHFHAEISCIGYNQTVRNHHMRYNCGGVENMGCWMRDGLVRGWERVWRYRGDSFE